MNFWWEVQWFRVNFSVSISYQTTFREIIHISFHISLDAEKTQKIASKAWKSQNIMKKAMKLFSHHQSSLGKHISNMIFCIPDMYSYWGQYYYVLCICMHTTQISSLHVCTYVRICVVLAVHISKQCFFSIENWGNLHMTWFRFRASSMVKDSLDKYYYTMYMIPTR